MTKNKVTHFNLVPQDSNKRQPTKVFAIAGLDVFQMPPHRQVVAVANNAI